MAKDRHMHFVVTHHECPGRGEISFEICGMPCFVICPGCWLTLILDWRNWR